MNGRTWNIYLIHHSHTDIGYTERQEKIIRYHYDFIRQAIEILDEIHSGKDSVGEGFVWQCENHWQVENFYELANEELKRKFEAYVKSGEIGLSGNYLNMTELVSEPVLNDALDRMESYGDSIGHKIQAGMSADINGFAWGYAEALYQHGVKYFYTALHPHHGMFPLYRKTRPWYWETPAGNRVLMWNGDHYHLGNEMFFAPHGGSDYTFHDEYSDGLRSYKILNREGEDVKEKEFQIVRARVERYLKNLEEEGYPYDLVPFMVSGAITDNAPPSKTIAQRVRELNAYYQGRIQVKMVTLEEFFREVEKRCTDIPVYKGDFTDWWADGIGSTPQAVKLYLEAVRKYDLCKKLDPEGTKGMKTLRERAMEELMMYAEHTWGYSSSVSEPWDSMVGSLEQKKSAYAICANTDISRDLDQVMAGEGEVSIRQDKPQRFIILNPHEKDLHTNAFLYIEFWEYIDGRRFDVTMPIEVRNMETGEVIPSQVKQIARATQVEIEVDLKAGEKITAEIHLTAWKPGTVKNHAHIGAEGVEDVLTDREHRLDCEVIDTDHFHVETDGEQGIKSIVWKADGSSLLKPDAKSAAFGGIYEITPMENVSPCEVRRQMGRNRKAMSTRRWAGRLTNRKIAEDGPLYCTLELDYQLEGTKMYDVFLKIYKHMPRMEATVRVHKTSCWEPENLYIALPFTAGTDSVLYTDKTGCIIRPGIDQLPGSCQDFYLIQNAVVWKGQERSVSVITKDAPLISLGGLEAKRIELCDGRDEKRNRSEVYSWPMNNFWETNFKVDLGGFYEFRYILQVKENQSVEDIFAECQAENEGILTGYSE